MGILSSIGKAVGSLTGSDWISAGSAALGFFGGERTNDANSAQAARQMQFQQYNSDTAYQRAVRDLKKAGLNPMLAYSRGGASTPGGAQATMGDSIGKGIEGFNSASQIQNVRADTQVKQSQASLNAAEEARVKAETPGPVDAADLMFSRVKQAANAANVTSQQWNNLQKEYDNLIKTGKLLDLDVGGKSIENALQQLSLVLQRATNPNLVNFQKGPGGAAAPYVRDFAAPATSAAGAYLGARGGRGASGSWGKSIGAPANVRRSPAQFPYQGYHRKVD
ncbi:MAG: DNA pilot protein [Microvirus sp.]|nr:MAG: DNA pilot protein [Microvirus sp.]